MVIGAYHGLILTLRVFTMEPCPPLYTQTTHLHSAPFPLSPFYTYTHPCGFPLGLIDSKFFFVVYLVAFHFTFTVKRCAGHPLAGDHTRHRRGACRPGRAGGCWSAGSHVPPMSPQMQIIPNSTEFCSKRGWYPIRMKTSNIYRPYRI